MTVPSAWTGPTALPCSAETSLDTWPSLASSQSLIEYCTNVSKVKCIKEVGHFQSAGQSSYKVSVGSSKVGHVKKHVIS